VPSALTKVFPNIGLVKSQFYKEKRHQNSAREALKKLAVNNPTEETAPWYADSREELLTAKV